MDFLTVKEAAELKGCSERYIQKLVKDGKLEAEMRMDESIRQMRYMIPLSALPEALQARWYKNQKTAAGLLPEVKEPKQEKPAKQKKPQRTFEELSEAERREVTLWTGIVQEWHGMRAGYACKTEFDKHYVGKCQLEHPDIKVSVDILYRKYAAYRDGNIEGLIDKRGAWNRGRSTIPAPVWDAFLWYWLDENQPTASLCYRETIKWTAEFYPELLDLIPTERCFRRHIEKDLSVALKTLMRDGEKAFADRCMPYIMRMYDELEANDCWIADNHTFDVISMNGETKHRLYLTAFLDAKSGVLVGWNITESPDSQSTILALRHGIMRFGIPKCIYVDNGREFLPFDFGGKGHRAKKNHDSHLDPTTILKRLDIEMRNAIVRNAKAKPVERTFRTVKEQFSKLFTGFCGGTILERPESLKRRVKNGQLPCDYEVRELLDAWIDGEFNLQEYGGSEQCFKGMSRLDVWNKSIRAMRSASESDLNLMLMRSTRKQKIKRNGVYITFAGEKLWYMHPEQTIMNLDREVFVRFDPADLRTVRIYDAATDKPLFVWQMADALMVDYLTEHQDAIADAQELIHTTKKFVREQKNGITASLSNEQRITMLDMTLRKAKTAKAEKFIIQKPTNIIPIMTHESPLEEKQAVGSENVVIDLTRMMRNASKRKEE